MKKIIVLACMLGALAAPSMAAVNPLSFDTPFATFTLPFQKVRGAELLDFKTKGTYTAVQTMLAGWGAKDANGDRAVEFSFGAGDNIGKHKKLPYVAIDAKLSKKLFDTSNNTFYFGGWGWTQKDLKGKSRPVGGIEANVLFW